MSNSNRPPVNDRLKKKQASTVKVRITMSDDIATALNEAENNYAMAQMQVMGGEGDLALQAKAEQAEAALQTARQAAEEDAIEFVFRSIGRKAYDKLVTDNQPTKQDEADVVAQGGDPKDLQWSPQSFPTALMAASIVHPQLSEEEVVEMWEGDNWSGNELQTLFFAALAAQQKSRVVQLGNA